MADQTIKNVSVTGGCYCGALRYRVTQRPVVKGQCHCRACQHIAGGGPQYFMIIPPDGFAWTAGAPATYTRGDLDAPVTRSFCAACGTHVITRRLDQSGVVLKVGTLDDPSRFNPRIAICHAQAQPFHLVPGGIPIFDDIPSA